MGSCAGSIWSRSSHQAGSRSSESEIWRSSRIIVLVSSRGTIQRVIIGPSRPSSGPLPSFQMGAICCTLGSTHSVVRTHTLSPTLRVPIEMAPAGVSMEVEIGYDPKLVGELCPGHDGMQEGGVDRVHGVLKNL